MSQNVPKMGPKMCSSHSCLLRVLRLRTRGHAVALPIIRLQKFVVGHLQPVTFGMISLPQHKSMAECIQLLANFFGKYMSYGLADWFLILWMTAVSI